MQACPNCGGSPKIHSRRGRYWIECNGDCWTQTSKYWELSDAVAEWNSILPTVKEEDASVSSVW
jgi:hypothetical protein